MATLRSYIASQLSADGRECGKAKMSLRREEWVRLPRCGNDESSIVESESSVGEAVR